MLRWPSSLRARLTLWYTLVLGAPLVAFAAGSYVYLERTLLTRTDHFISDALTAFVRELGAERARAMSTENAVRLTVSEVRFRDLRIVVADSLGKPIAIGTPVEEGRGESTPSIPLDGDEMMREVVAQSGGPAAPFAFVAPGPLGGYRVVARPIVLTGQSLRVAAAYPMRDIREVLDRVGKAFSIAIPLLLISAALGGYFLAKRSLSPVSAMGARAAEISASTLDARLPVVSPNDELGGLATVINALLDRLEASFAQQRRFMADASHELRTPAAILRTEVDVTLSRPQRTEAEYRESAAVMQDAAHRLTRIVDDLFLLARSDAGHLVARCEPLYLEEIVHDATRAVRHLADARGVRVDLGAVVEAPFEGDSDLLGRLILNLLDNAIKYSPSGATVTATLQQYGSEYHVSVVDEGKGIPEAMKDKIFERFYRLDAARSRAERTATSGAGLGLAIARRIAEVHGGRLELVSSHPGRTEFRLTLPVSATPRDVALPVTA